MPKNADIFTLRTVANKMIALRWQKAMLDTDLAALYGVEGKDACPALNFLTVFDGRAARSPKFHEMKHTGLYFAIFGFRKDAAQTHPPFPGTSQSALSFLGKLVSDEIDPAPYSR